MRAVIVRRIVAAVADALIAVDAAAAAAAVDAMAAVVEAGVVETIIRGMHASRANRAGSFLVFWKQPDA